MTRLVRIAGFSRLRLGSWTPTLLVLALVLASPRARADTAGLPLDPDQYPEVQALDAVASEIISAVGILADHRPYQPATPLGPTGVVDVGAEVTIVKIPNSFRDAVLRGGLSQNLLPPLVLPTARLHLHRGVGERMEIGASALVVRGYRMIGGDVKLALSDPQAEGPLVAVRFSYSVSKVGFVQTKTYTPQILLSKKMDFADPYMGLGYEYVTGELYLNVTQKVAPAYPGGPTQIRIDNTYSGVGGGMIAFLGLAFRVPLVGFRLTLEGTYSKAGASSMGTKIGFSF